jgi:hypothetical protein
MNNFFVFFFLSLGARQNKRYEQILVSKFAKQYHNYLINIT